MARAESRRWWHAMARRCCAWPTSSRSATTTRWTPISAGWRSTCAGSTASTAPPRARGCGSSSSTRRWRSGAPARSRSTATTSTSTRASRRGCATSRTSLAGGERVDRSVEALKALKPDEARALLLKAEGLSYQEIGKRFGWSYTKVNRSITEGRKRFLNVFGEIESGEACEAYGEVLSALATGTATSAQVVSIRPHLRHCAACRATVREMRFSRARRLALFGPFAWLARLLTRPEVYAVSTGGGRLGPAAAAIGLCLSGVGAATCVMTGAIPAAAPLIAVVDEKPSRSRRRRRSPSARRPNAPRRRPRRWRPSRSSRHPTPTPPKRTARKTPAREAREEEASASKSEFGFEAKAPKGSSTPAPVKATVSNVGGGGNTPGGSAPAPSRAGSSGSRAAEIMRAWRARMTSPACTTT